MLNIVWMDWLTMGWRGTLGLSVFFFLTLPEGWEHALSMDFMALMLVTILFCNVEETWNGRSLCVSLPIGRAAFIRSRFVSAWVFVLYSQLVFAVVIFIRLALFPDTHQALLGIFQFRNLMFLLSLTTALLLPLTLLYARFNGKIVLYTFIAGLLLTISPLVTFSVVSGQPDAGNRIAGIYGHWGNVCKDTLLDLLRYHDPSLLNDLIVVVTLILINLATLRLAEKIFQRNNIRQ